MKLPFCVYTARHGYDWQSGLENGREKLERFRQSVGKMPEFDYGDPESCGFINLKDDVIAYRYMHQQNADNSGRDAAYLAMTFFSREDARFINAEILFLTYPFNEPLATPPSSFEYQGSAAVPINFDFPVVSKSEDFSKEGTLASAGFLFSKDFSGTLRVYCIGNPEVQPAFEFVLPPIKKTPNADVQKAETVKCIIRESQEPRSNISVFWRNVAVCLIVIAVIEALVILWLFLDPLGDLSGTMDTKVSEVYTEGVAQPGDNGENKTYPMPPVLDHGRNVPSMN